ncbi:MAG: AGE family epimerase/isomerase [Bacteroidales bacterium]|nr:AGE family epimerase/isomerase [Bacteroidales bacterium]
MVDPRGGFYGHRDAHDVLDPDAPKGAILNARILWSFAAAARATGREDYRAMARRALDYCLDHFIDRENGGVYWSLTADGAPLDTKKQFYAIAFMIYGLSEYYRMDPDPRVLDEAIALFRVIERFSRDREKGGYIEALTRDWQPIADMRLSDKDANSSKTMNTHLHILEGYANLLRVWPTEECKEAVASLLHIFYDKIENPQTHHLGLFFDDDWHCEDGGIQSFGHDIEASWLLLEAAQVLGDEALLQESLAHTRKIAEAALEGRCYDGSMVYERHADGRYDNEKHWWVQAELMVGLLYLAAYHQQPQRAAEARQTWQWIDSHLVDHEHGEWQWSPGSPKEKAGFWKCPYHNSRSLLEAMALASKV